MSSVRADARESGVQRAARSRHRRWLPLLVIPLLLGAGLWAWQAREAGLRRAAYLSALRGDELREQGNEEEARRAYERATRLDPGSAYAWHMLGMSKLDSGDLTGIEALAEAVRRAPGNADFTLEYGSALRRSNRALEARPVLKRATELAPDQARAFAELGRAYHNASSTTDELAASIEAFKTALALEPGDIQTRFRLAQVYYQHGRLDEARREFTMTLSLLTEGARRMVGQAPGDSKEANTWLSIVKGAHYHLAQIAYRQGDRTRERRHRKIFDELAAYLQEAYSLFSGPEAPADPGVRARRANELYRKFNLPPGGFTGSEMAERWIPSHSEPAP